MTHQDFQKPRVCWVGIEIVPSLNTGRLQRVKRYNLSFLRTFMRWHKDVWITSVKTKNRSDGLSMESFLDLRSTYVAAMTTPTNIAPMLYLLVRTRKHDQRVRLEARRTDVLLSSNGIIWTFSSMRVVFCDRSHKYKLGLRFKTRCSGCQSKSQIMEGMCVRDALELGRRVRVDGIVVSFEG